MTDVIEKFTRFYTDLASMQIDELSLIYSDDIEFVDPVKSHKGIESVKSYFSGLLENAKHCQFTIHEVMPETITVVNSTRGSQACSVTWTMEFKSNKLNGGNLISVDGITTLRVADNKIVYHRDYYDLGQMVYENVPLLGHLIKTIKRSVA